MKERKCKFCGKKNQTKRSDFCSFNCYQKWRYHNIPEEKKRIKERSKKNHTKRYKEDEEYRKRAIGYVKDWQRRHPDRVREIARKSARKQYLRKKQDGKNN